jgi:predicted RNase H-like HicB family nuclease
MDTKVLRYNVVLKKEGKDYIAHVPTLGISDFGKSITEAKKNVKDAIEIHIEGLAKTGTQIPKADTSEFINIQTEVVAPKNAKFAF